MTGTDPGNAADELSWGFGYAPDERLPAARDDDASICEPVHGVQQLPRWRRMRFQSACDVRLGAREGELHDDRLHLSEESQVGVGGNHRGARADHRGVAEIPQRFEILPR